jgi:peptide/nickel transport system ATP-binding protein
MDAFNSKHGTERAPHAGRTVLEVRDLRTYFFTDAGIVRAVDGVSFSVAAGETLGIVGESGSGKSVTALSLIRLLDEPSRIVGGEIRFEGRDVRAMNPEELRALRGDGVAMIFQDPMTSLNPVLRIARQLTETMLAHGKFDQTAATARSVSLLGRMGITAPERAIDCYPHQFSGGMRQRVMLAMGFSNEPALLLADEPTTALDVTIQAQILALIAELNRDFGTAIVLISHDLGVIASVCARVIVMYAGEVVEEGPTELILSDPRHPYTWALINAVPRLDRHVPGQRRLTTIEGAPPDPLVTLPGCRFAARCPFRIPRCDTPPALAEISPGRKTRCWVTQQGAALPLSSREIGSVEVPGVPAFAETCACPSAFAGTTPVAPVGTLRRGAATSALAEPLLSVRGLVKHFPLSRNKLFGRPQVVHAVDGVDLDVFPGETVGLVGESGCGKSTFARVVVRIHEPTAGSVRFAGHEIARAAPAAIRPLRRRMQMIFQDPYGSLNPRLTVAEAVGEPLRFHGITTTRAATAARIAELLVAVGLSPKAGERFPHEFSGGQRQRISIARALAIGADFIVADEPISALDVNIQAQIINLLVDLQERFRLTYLFIAHDLAVVRHICDRVVVLYLGKVVEVAPADDLFQAPLHPYTRYLISAVPIPDATVERRRRRVPLAGEPPSAIDPPSGCYFRTRCPHAKQVCAEMPPALIEQAHGHFAACHFAGQL